MAILKSFLPTEDQLKALESISGTITVYRSSKLLGGHLSTLFLKTESGQNFKFAFGWQPVRFKFDVNNLIITLDRPVSNVNEIARLVPHLNPSP